MPITRRYILIQLGTSLGAWILGVQKSLAQSLPGIDLPLEDILRPDRPRIPGNFDFGLFQVRGLDFICVEPNFASTQLRFSVSRSFNIPLNVQVETPSPAISIASNSNFTLPAGTTSFEVSFRPIGIERGRRVASGNLRILVSSDRFSAEKRVNIFIKQTRGGWKDGGVLELVGIHVAMMPNGQVLFFGYNDKSTFVDEKGRYQLWSPETRSPNGSSAGLSGWNPFCAGHSFLGDGRLFVAGGFKFGDPARSSAADKVRTVGVFTEAGRPTVRWDESFEKMEDKRWYPTCVTLANGNSLIIGGSAPFAADNWKDTDEDIEFFDTSQNRLIQKIETKQDYPRDEKFRPLSGDRRQVVADGQRLAGLYPLAHLLPNTPGDDAPNGLLFVLTEMFARVYNPSTNRIISPKIDVGGFRTWWTQASSVLLPIDINFEGDGPRRVRIIVFGGGTTGKGDSAFGDIVTGDEGRRAPALSNATVLEYDISTRRLTIDGTFRLRRPRFMGDSILLPDGNILLIGGASKGFANDNSEGIVTAELITPTSSSSFITTKDFASARIVRGYHASALLCPDGAVLVAGGTCGWNNAPTCEQFSVEVFEPPYFSCGLRPEIVSVPERLTYGQRFEVESQGTNIREQIILIRCGSRTHSLDTDQRMLRLQARRRSDVPWVLQARMPRNRTYAPPGPYMMFLLRDDNHGVPSLAKFVQIS